MITQPKSRFDLFKGPADQAFPLGLTEGQALVGVTEHSSQGRPKQSAEASLRRVGLGITIDGNGLTQLSAVATELYIYTVRLDANGSHEVLYRAVGFHLPEYLHHRAVETASDSHKGDLVAFVQSTPLQRERESEGHRSRTDIAQERVSYVGPLGIEMEALKEELMVPLSDLVTDEQVDIVRLPAEFRLSFLPGALGQLYARLHQGSRVNDHLCGLTEAKV